MQMYSMIEKLKKRKAANPLKIYRIAMLFDFKLFHREFISSRRR